MSDELAELLMMNIYHVAGEVIELRARLSRVEAERDAFQAAGDALANAARAGIRVGFETVTGSPPRGHVWVADSQAALACWEALRGSKS